MCQNRFEIDLIGVGENQENKDKECQYARAYLEVHDVHLALVRPKKTQKKATLMI